MDCATVDLLAALARRRTPAQLLLVATYRPVDLVLGGHPLRALTQDLRVYHPRMSLCATPSCRRRP